MAFLAFVVITAGKVCAQPINIIARSLIQHYLILKLGKVHVFVPDKPCFLVIDSTKVR